MIMVRTYTQGNHMSIPTPDQFAALRRIAARLADQDNRGTMHAAYEVQKMVRRTGIDPDQVEDGGILWVENGEEIPSSLWRIADQAYEDDATSFIDPEETDTIYQMDHLERIGFVLDWETVQTCFTQEGAQAYINRNGHNLDDHAPPRIMGESFHRNHEMIAVRELLPKLLAAYDQAKDES